MLRIHLPALRERREDIGLIATKFLNRAVHGQTSAASRIPAQGAAPHGALRLARNIRELRNVIEHIVILNDDDRVTADMLPEFIRALPAPSAGAEAAQPRGHRPARRHAGLPRADPAVLANRARPHPERAGPVRRQRPGSGAPAGEISPATLYRKIEK